MCADGAGRSSTISENSAGDSCGGLAILGGFCEVSTGMLEYNTAVNGGGAVCAMGSARVAISSTNLKHNSAGLKGGAVLVGGRSSAEVLPCPHTARRRMLS